MACSPLRLRLADERKINFAAYFLAANFLNGEHMSCAPNCPCTPAMADLAFRESELFIDREITDRSYRMNRYLMDYAPVKIFPDGSGYSMTKVRFFGDIGPQYDGYDGWRKEQRSRPVANGCGPKHDACGYVWEEVGHGFEELHFSLMRRDLRTIPICVHDIRTFWEFQQYQNLIFQNLTEISANMREQLNRNALIGFSVKHVVTSKGLEINSANPYELPNIAGVTLGKLNFRVLKRLYSALIREAGMFALDTIDGRPVFGLMASDETIDDMFMEDPDVRQDLRWSSMADSLLKRYNFMDTVRGQFIVIPDPLAARYTVDASGNLTRVFPYERDVQIQSGTRPAPNPAYDLATFEYVQILTRDVFALRSRKAISTVGGNTDFNAETSMFEWKWHNPERWCDPNRRVGFYFANGELGVEPGDFTDIPGILVQRRPFGLDAQFWPAAVCPPDEVDCDNELAVQGCPTPQVVGCCEDLTDATRLQLRFSSPLPGMDAETPYNITLELDDGSLKVVSVVAESTDLCAATVDFGSETPECCVGRYVQVLAVTPNACSAPVVSETCSDNGLVHTLTMQYPLKAFANGATVSALGSDGVYRDVTITTGASSLTYIATYAALLPEGVCTEALCIPTLLDAACPACSPAAVTCDPDTGLPD